MRTRQRALKLSQSKARRQALRLGLKSKPNKSEKFASQLFVWYEYR